MDDPIVSALGQYQWVSQHAYPSPLYIGRVPEAYYDTVYKTRHWGMHTCLQVTYSAPTYSYKANTATHAAHSKRTSLGYMTGAAPTKGIYTGIPSGCSAAGLSGGNPYS